MFEAKQKAAATKVSIELGLEFKPLKYPTKESQAAELFRRLVQQQGWKAEDAIEGIRERFPSIDLKALESKDV